MTGFFDTFLDPDYKTQFGPQPSQEIIERRAELSKKVRASDYLSTRIAFVDHYDLAIPAILDGNRKPYVDESDERQYKAVLNLALHGAELLTARAYSKAAAGDRQAAIQSLLEALTLSHRLNGFNFLGNLYGALGEKAAFEEMADLLPSLSVKELQTVRLFANRSLSEPTNIGKIIDGSQAFFESGWQTISPFAVP
jgi:hypothetical protein